VAIIGLASRAVIGHGGCSNTQRCGSARRAGGGALRFGKPGIFNTDQGSTSPPRAFTSKLVTAGVVVISMDGRGRFMDNISSKPVVAVDKVPRQASEAYADGCERGSGISSWMMKLYNFRRHHQAR